MSANQSMPGAETGAAAKLTLRRRLATSQGLLPRVLRRILRFVRNFSVPAPQIVVKPILWIFLLLRNAYYFAVRVFICEPLFKAYCKQYGRNLHTDCHLHWVSGKGDIILGDNVCIDGKVSIGFAARYSNRPTLEMGDNCGIGHGCSFTIGKRITLGRNTLLSGDVIIMDSNAHPTDPGLRGANQPLDADEVRPVVIGEGVWIGRRCIIFPGVKIGNGSVISAGSVVRTHVPPYSVVAGNPARVMFRMKKPEPVTPAQ